MVEQGTHKPLVVGSTPTLGTCTHAVGTIIPIWDTKQGIIPQPSPLPSGLFCCFFSSMPGNPEHLEQFEIGLILAGAVNPANVRRQLSLRVSAGRLIQLPRGLYSLAAPYRQTPPRPFLVAIFSSSSIKPRAEILTPVSSKPGPLELGRKPTAMKACSASRTLVSPSADTVTFTPAAVVSTASISCPARDLIPRFLKAFSSSALTSSSI